MLEVNKEIDNAVKKRQIGRRISDDKICKNETFQLIIEVNKEMKKLSKDYKIDERTLRYIENISFIELKNAHNLKNLNFIRWNEDKFFRGLIDRAIKENLKYVDWKTLAILNLYFLNEIEEMDKYNCIKPKDTISIEFMIIRLNPKIIDHKYLYKLFIKWFKCPISNCVYHNLPSIYISNSKVKRLTKKYYNHMRNNDHKTKQNIIQVSFEKILWMKKSKYNKIHPRLIKEIFDINTDNNRNETETIYSLDTFNLMTQIHIPNDQNDNTEEISTTTFEEDLDLWIKNSAASTSKANNSNLYTILSNFKQPMLRIKSNVNNYVKNGEFEKQVFHSRYRGGEKSSQKRKINIKTCNNQEKVNNKKRFKKVKESYKCVFCNKEVDDLKAHEDSTHPKVMLEDGESLFSSDEDSSTATYEKSDNSNDEDYDDWKGYIKEIRKNKDNKTRHKLNKDKDENENNKHEEMQSTSSESSEKNNQVNNQSKRFEDIKNNREDFPVEIVEHTEDYTGTDNDDIPDF